jgi:hypothetical protein
VLPSKEELAAMAIKAQKAASSFFWVSLPIALTAGAASILIDSSAELSHRLLVVSGSCVAYGWALAWLGRRGYLPIMEEGG